MASSSQQQLAQVGLAHLVTQDLQAIYPLIDPQDVDSEMSKLTLLVQAITTKYGRLSGALSGRFYQAQRVESGLGRHSAVVAPVPPREQVAKVVGWATHDNAGQVIPFDQAQRRIDAGATKLVQDVGRLTVIGSVKADPKARGWARITEADPCYFCALLSSRGGVYTKETGDFKSHDHCRCHVVPEFAVQTPEVAAALSRGRQWASDYQTATKARQPGVSLLNTWRQYYDSNV